MMILGDFRFSIDSAAYQELMRVSEYRWAAQEVFGVLPRLQYTGPGSDSITLQGTVYPEYRGGLEQINTMRSVAEQGKPQRMISGSGRIMGQWVIEKVQEKQPIFAAGGIPRQQDFTLQLKRFS